MVGDVRADSEARRPLQLALWSRCKQETLPPLHALGSTRPCLPPARQPSLPDNQHRRSTALKPGSRSHTQKTMQPAGHQTACLQIASLLNAQLILRRRCARKLIRLPKEVALHHSEHAVHLECSLWAPTSAPAARGAARRGEAAAKVAAAAGAGEGGVARARVARGRATAAHRIALVGPLLIRGRGPSGGQLVRVWEALTSCPRFQVAPASGVSLRLQRPIAAVCCRGAQQPHAGCCRSPAAAPCASPSTGRRLITLFTGIPLAHYAAKACGLVAAAAAAPPRLAATVPRPNPGVLAPSCSQLQRSEGYDPRQGLGVHCRVS